MIPQIHHEGRTHALIGFYKARLANAPEQHRREIQAKIDNLTAVLRLTPGLKAMAPHILAQKDGCGALPVFLERLQHSTPKFS